MAVVGQPDVEVGYLTRPNSRTGDVDPDFAMWEQVDCSHPWIIAEQQTGRGGESNQFHTTGDMIADVTSSFPRSSYAAVFCQVAVYLLVQG